MVALQVIGELSLAPLGPNEVRASQLHRLITVFLVVFHASLPDEALRFLTVPPAAPLNHLAHDGVVVAPPNVELEVVAALLRLNLLVAFIQNFVQLLHQSQVNGEQEIWLFEFGPVELHPMSLRHRYAKVLEQVDNSALLQLKFLFEQTHHELVHFVDRLVHLAPSQMLKMAQLEWLQFARPILLIIRFRHAVIVPIIEILFLALGLHSLLLLNLGLRFKLVSLGLVLNLNFVDLLDWLGRLEHQAELHRARVLDLLAFHDWGEALIVDVAVHEDGRVGSEELDCLLNCYVRVHYAVGEVLGI